MRTGANPFPTRARMMPSEWSRARFCRITACSVATLGSGFEHEILAQKESDKPDDHRLNAECEESRDVSEMMKQVESNKPFEDSDCKVSNQLVEGSLGKERCSHSVFWKMTTFCRTSTFRRSPGLKGRVERRTSGIKKQKFFVSVVLGASSLLSSSSSLGSS